MSALAASLVTAFVTAVLAIAGTYVTTRRELQHRFDSSLRDLRMDAYKKLWRELEELAKYARPEPLTKARARALAETLRKWYFETGGLFLSDETRGDYFALLDGLESVTAGAGKTVGEDGDEFLRVLGSRLRTGMTRDVGTRRTFPFRERGRGAGVDRIRTFVSPDGTRLTLRPPQPRFYVLPGKEPVVGLPGMAGRPRWDLRRRAFTARVQGLPEVEDERTFLLEDGHLVEGPKGWTRWSEARRPGAVLWREEHPPAEG